MNNMHKQARNYYFLSVTKDRPKIFLFTSANLRKISHSTFHLSLCVHFRTDISLPNPTDVKAHILFIKVIQVKYTMIRIWPRTSVIAILCPVCPIILVYSLAWTDRPYDLLSLAFPQPAPLIVDVLRIMQITT